MLACDSGPASGSEKIYRLQLRFRPKPKRPTPTDSNSGLDSDFAALHRGAVAFLTPHVNARHEIGQSDTNTDQNYMAPVTSQYVAAKGMLSGSRASVSARRGNGKATPAQIRATWHQPCRSISHRKSGRFPGRLQRWNVRADNSKMAVSSRNNWQG